MVDKPSERSRRDRIPRRWADEEFMIQSSAWRNWTLFLVLSALSVGSAFRMVAALLGVFSLPAGQIYEAVIWWIQALVTLAAAGGLAFLEARGLISRYRRRIGRRD